MGCYRNRRTFACSAVCIELLSSVISSASASAFDFLLFRFASAGAFQPRSTALSTDTSILTSSCESEDLRLEAAYCPAEQRTIQMSGACGDLLDGRHTFRRILRKQHMLPLITVGLSASSLRLLGDDARFPQSLELLFVKLVCVVLAVQYPGLQEVRKLGQLALQLVDFLICPSSVIDTAR